jgi:hypothetical protein
VPSAYDVIRQDDGWKIIASHTSTGEVRFPLSDSFCECPTAFHMDAAGLDEPDRIAVRIPVDIGAFARRRAYRFFACIPP